jgi:hypothetical protein
MEPIVILIIGLIVFIIVLRIMFKVAGFVIKLLVLVAVGLAIYWVVTGM